MKRLTVVLIFCVATIAETRYVSFDELYESGLHAYRNNEWKLSISNLEKSIESYRHYRNGIVNCYKKCKNTSSENPLLKQSHLGRITLKAVCNRECFDEEFGDFRLISGISHQVKQSFEELVPYQYLQYAYFQEGLLAKSVSSTYTFILRFPEDEMMKGNIEYFRGSDDVSDDMFVNMEPRTHLEKYDAAVQAYLKEDYENAAKNFEISLEEYYKSVEECHAICENESTFDEEESKENFDFYKQTAYLYIRVLECSLKCVQNLASDFGDKKYPNFVPVQYHYLQFSYYQNRESLAYWLWVKETEKIQYIIANNIEKAVECAKSYLVFHPNDTVMLKNLRLHSNDVGNSDDIYARKDAIFHHKQIKIEVAMLKYSYQYFGIKSYDETTLVHFEDANKKNEDSDFDEENIEFEEDENGETLEKDVHPVKEEKASTMTDDDYESMEQKTDDIIKRKQFDVERRLAEKEKKERDEKHYIEPDDDVDISHIKLANVGQQTVDSKYIITIGNKTDEVPLSEGPILYEGTTLLANSTQLKGRERFAVDNLASKEECASLVDLELSFGNPGDGYGGKSSPHTQHEVFEGVTLINAVNLAKEGLLPLSTAILYYDLSEKARAQVQAYFKLPHLFFDYTHLVCRTSNADSPLDRKDLSHPIHADNCLLKSDGRCVKERPAYIWRDYSAILYLNEDFDGGEFLFADSTARRVRVQVKPKCGRMVSFGAGHESFHGVKPVLKGRRCAVALWFTLSEDRKEKQRMEAEDILYELASRQLETLKQKDEL